MTQLNIGCGMDTWGDIRLDKFKTEACTLQYNFEAGLPFDSESVDEIRLWAVLEHTPNPGRLLDECYRVLKKGGKIDLLTDYAGFVGQYLFKSLEHNARLETHYANEKNPTERDGHYAIYVPSHLQRQLKGFEIKETYYRYGRRGKFIAFVLRCLPFKLGAINIGVVAVKK